MNDHELVKNVFTTCKDPVTIKQLAFMIGRQRTAFDLNSENPVFAKLETEIQGIKEIFSQENMHKHFISLATDLDVLPPKTAEDIFKSHLEESKVHQSQIDSAKVNLATTYVNAFVNAGYG